MSFDSEQFREHFRDIRSLIWLNTAGAAPGAQPVVSAMTAALTSWQRGEFDSHASYDLLRRSCELFGELINAEPNSIAFVPTAAAGASTVADSLPKDSKRKKIVAGRHEFRSNYLPWHDLAQKFPKSFEIYPNPKRTKAADVRTTEDYLNAIDEKTLLVAVSSVQFQTGFRVDVEAIAREAKKNGALLFVDATQAVGALRFDVRKLKPDFLVAHGYKWLLCPRGAAWLYAKPRSQKLLRSLAPSWIGAKEPYKIMSGPLAKHHFCRKMRRLDFSPPWFIPAALVAALNLLLKQDTVALEAHCIHLANEFRKRAPKHLKFAPTDMPSHLVGIKVRNSKAAVKRLQQDMIVAGNRGSFLRVGFHGFNTEEDVNRTLQALEQIR